MPYKSLLTVVAALLLSAAVAIPAAAGTSAPTVRACGDTTADGVLIGDVTAKRTTCANARKIARLVPDRCGATGACTINKYTCFSAAATGELNLVRCSKAQGNSELYRVIRFDWGS